MLCRGGKKKEEGVVLCFEVGGPAGRTLRLAGHGVKLRFADEARSALGELAEAQVCPHFVLLRDLYKRKTYDDQRLS